MNANLHKRPAVVVGVDGSASSLWALRWAAREARMRRCPLRVVTVYHWDAPPVPGSGLSPDLHELAVTTQRAALTEAADDLDGLQVEREVVFGAAPSSLLAASTGAEVLVVGTHGHSGLARLVVGSVSHSVVQHATCPVVVVPEPTPVPMPEAEADREPEAEEGTRTLSTPLF